VLEPFVRPCRYANQGERVVQGQRIIQAASDLFLGWKTFDDHDFYVRQLKDMKGTVDIDEMDPQTIVDFAELCGMTLGHAHARSGDFCQIAGYLGKGERLDTAITEFAEAYADHVERDHALLEKEVRAGRITVEHVAYLAVHGATGKQGPSQGRDRCKDAVGTSAPGSFLHGTSPFQAIRTDPAGDFPVFRTSYAARTGISTG